MAFLFWLWIHVAACLAQGIILGRDSRYSWRNLDNQSLAVVLMWYCVPLSWVVERDAPTKGMLLIGFAMYTAGMALTTAAKAVNPHFQPLITVSPKVITAGVYRLRHPGYIGMVLAAIGTIWMLNSPSGYFPLTCYALILLTRAVEEDRLIAAIECTSSFHTEASPLIAFHYPK